MKIALISDIHSNLYALESILRDIESNNIDRIYCLGDIVGYHSFPNEVIDLIKKKHIISIKGNHDKDISELSNNYKTEDIKKWTFNQLKEDNINYLKTLPEKLIIDIDNYKIMLVHGSPNDITEYLFEDSPISENYIKKINGNVLVCAHTHFPYIKYYKDKILINSGSVGKPKIGKPTPNYIIFDSQRNFDNLAQIKFVNYDFNKAADDMIKKGLSEKVAKELILGKTI